MTTWEPGSSVGQDLSSQSRLGGRDEDRSIGEILGDVTTDLSTLMRQELELAKAELKQTATRAGTGAGLFGGAAVAGHMVLLFVSIALWWSLGMLIGHGWSGLLVALIWAVIAAVLAVTGRSQLARARGVPQTTETVAKIPDALKGNDTTTPPPAAQSPTTQSYTGNGQETYR